LVSRLWGDRKPREVRNLSASARVFS
jgi:hypothetical protein